MPRKTKSQDSNPYEGIRHTWELPYLMQFITLHQSKFKFPLIRIQDFEDSLLETTSVILPDIFARLLRYLSGNTEIKISTFEHHLNVLLTSKRQDNNPLKDRQLSDLSPEQKLQLLKWLVDHICESRQEELGEYLDDNHDPETMRATNVGQDAFNNTYWYFDDLRLYKESSTKKATKKDWECVCITLNDWHLFLKQFRKSTNPQEREFFQYLGDKLFPLIEKQLENQEREQTDPNFAGEKNLDHDSLLKKEEADIIEMLNEQEKEKEKISTDDMKVKVESTPELAPPATTATPTTNTNGETGPQPPNGIEPKIEKEENNVTNGQKPNVSTPSIDDPITSPAAQVPVPGAVPTPGATQALKPLPSQPGPQPPKSSQGMDSSHFMQQQSQIFVFSTEWANKASEAVLNGQYKSIISYHMDQPGTKNMLQKHPIKQFGQQGPMYSMADMNSGDSNGLQASNMINPGQQWMPQGGIPGRQMKDPMNPNYMPGPPDGNFPPQGQGPNMGPWNGQSAMGSLQQMAAANQSMQNLSQSKVPNENLTPEQLQRREEQLANLRKIQQMLFPEQNDGGSGPGGPGPMPQSMMQADMYTQQTMMSSQSMMNPQQGMVASQQNVMMTQQSMSMQEDGIPTKAVAQREWMRLQQQFYMEKRRYQQEMQQENMMFPPNQQGMPQNFPGNAQGPPPSYRSSIQGRQCMPLSPTSPNPAGMMTGPRGPMGTGPMGGPPRPALMGGPMGPGSHPTGSIGSPPIGGPRPSPLQMQGPMPSPGAPMQSPLPGGPVMSPHPGGPMPSPHPGMPPMSSPHTMGPMSSPHPLGAMSSPHPMGPMSHPLSPHHMQSPHPGMTSPSHPSPMPGDNQQFQFPGGPPGPGPGFPGGPGPGPGPGFPGGPGPGPGQRRSAMPPMQVPPNGPLFGPNGPMGPGSMDMMGGPMMGNPPNSMNPMVRPPGPKNSQVMVGKVGNPEQFQIPADNATGPTKPPPSYAQSTKRKRTEDLEDLYKNLQPAPSPQQMNYMNQYEGQELIITKQLNTAYQENADKSTQPPPAQKPRTDQYPHSQQMRSPMAASVSSPMSGQAKSQHGSLPGTPTMASAPQPSPGQPNTASSQMAHHSPTVTSTTQEQISSPRPVSGAGRRLSHYDPPATASTTSGGKSTMSNITSASLANLAKGVEHLSNQMQQNMMQGGPFHNIQIQSQMTSVNQENSESTSTGGASNSTQVPPETAQAGPPHPPKQHPQQHKPPLSINSSVQNQQTPSVNNTYVNATMSIQQLNIQSVATPGYNHSMQVQQMNNDMTSMSTSMPAGSQAGGQSTGMTYAARMEKDVFMEFSGSQQGKPFPNAQPGGQYPGRPMPGGPSNPDGHFPRSGPQSAFFDSPPGMGPGGMGPFPGPQQGMPGRFPNPNSHPDLGGDFPMGMQGGGPRGMDNPSHSQFPPSMGPGSMGPGMYPGPHRPPFGGSQPTDMMNTPSSYQGQQPGGPGNAPPPPGNANVKIQAKAPNTIQYLPAHPPSAQIPPGGAGPGGPLPGGPPRSMGPSVNDFEMMQRLGNPLANMDSKIPSSKLSYFPEDPSDPTYTGGGHPMSHGPNMGVPPGSQHPMMMQGNPGPLDMPFGSPDRMPGMDHPPMPGMDPSRMPGMDPSRMPGMDPSRMPGMDPSRMNPGNPMMQQSMTSQGMMMGGPHMRQPGPHQMRSQDYGMQMPPSGNFHQFQQQLYAAGDNSRQMGPPPNSQFMNMMPNMPGRP